MRTTLVLGLALIAHLAGCATGSPASPQTVVVREDTRTGILVSAKGTAEAAPDTAVFHVGVEALRPTVAEAREASAQAAAAMLEAIEAAGVAEDNIRTEQLSLRPQYEHTEAGRNLTGYVATNVVRVRTKDLDGVSAAVDAALKAGGDDARLYDIELELDDDASARAEAREEAMAEARSEAEQLAELAGVELGAPVAIEESRSEDGPHPMMMRASEEAAETRTPVRPGTTTVRAHVSVRYEIAR